MEEAQPQIAYIPDCQLLEGQEREERETFIRNALAQGKAVEFTLPNGLRKVITKWTQDPTWKEDLICCRSNGRTNSVCWAAKAYNVAVIDRP